jgi:hypothetical protein
MTARAAIVALSLCACDLRNGYSVHDTEGWTYRVSCTHQTCSEEVQAPHAPRPGFACGGGSQRGFAIAGKRVVVACHACVRAGVALRVDVASCRALACEHDNECAPFRGGSPVRCVHGLCAVPGESDLDEAASVGLCMAGAGPSGGDEPPNHVADRVALGRAGCDANGRCAPPAGCRAP